jgi:hypothetical protein
MQQTMMRKSQPMRWIEEAEARQVVTLALSEAPQQGETPRLPQAPNSWIAYLRGWRLARSAVATEDTIRTRFAKPLRR